MRNNKFFKHPLLSFAELRYSRASIAPFKPHIHQRLSIGAVDQGKVVYDINGEKGVLSPGSLVLINPDTLHVCNPANGTIRSYYMLHLSTAWCFQVQQSLWEVDGFTGVEKIRIDDAKLYEQFCKTMGHMMDEKKLLQGKEQMLYELVCKIFYSACSPGVVKKEPKKDIKHLKRLLSKDLQRDLPLNLLAEKLGVNPYTLIRSFKAVTGITPHAYRMNCRIEHARTLLKQGRDIADTALECGFFDQSHFHRHFKAMTTVTPQEYRVNFIQ